MNTSGTGTWVALGVLIAMSATPFAAGQPAGPTQTTAITQRLDRVRACMKDKRPVRVVCYGDSISEVSPGWSGGASKPEQNWGQQLGRMLEAAYPGNRFDVAPCGIGGQNAYEALGRVRSLKDLAPDLVLIEFGTNDTCHHFLQPDETARALSELVDTIRAQTKSDIVMLGTPGGNPLVPGKPPFVHADETLAAIRGTAQAKAVPFVEIRSAMLKATENGRRWAEFNLAADNCHPNDAGHHVWAEAVMAVVQSGLD